MSKFSRISVDLEIKDHFWSGTEELSVAEVVARLPARAAASVELDPGTSAAHPRFQPAMRAAMSAAIELYQGNRLLNALATDRARFLLSILCFHLHYVPEPGQPHAGFTVTRARELCTRLHLCSPGRAAAILALMRWGRYLAPAAAGTEDRRVRRLVPTDRLADLHRERWRGQLAAAAMVIPQMRPALPWIEHPVFPAIFAIAQSRELLAGIRPIDAAPELELFADRTCGMLILFSILLAREPTAAQSPPGRASAIAIATLARRFGVSRSHVNQLLRDAQRAGLLRYGGRGDAAIVVEPILVEAVDRLFLRVFGLNASCAIAAAAAIEGAERSGCGKPGSETIRHAAISPARP